MESGNESGLCAFWLCKSGTIASQIHDADDAVDVRDADLIDYHPVIRSCDAVWCKLGQFWDKIVRHRSEKGLQLVLPGL